MIDFSHTSEINGVVEFQNEKGETVITYPTHELEAFVETKQLNYLSSPIRLEKINGQIEAVSDHEFHDLEDYIDKNWLSVTEQFYNFKNKN